MKKLLKIVGWAAAGLVILLALAVIAITLFFPVERAKEMAVERGSRMLGRPLAVEDVAVSLWGGLGIKLKKVTISSPAGMEVGDFLTADAIDLKLRILPLLTGRYRVDKLVVNRPQITMLKTATGATNYTFALAQERKPPADQLIPEAKAAALAVSFQRLVVKDGSLDYRDDSTDIEMRLTGLDLSTALANPRSRFYESSGKIGIDSVALRVGTPIPTLACEIRYEAAYDMAQQRLVLDETELIVNELTFTVNGELQHGGPLLARGGIKSRPTSLEELFSLLPAPQQAELQNFSIKGEFALDADLEYDKSRKKPLSYSGTAVLSDMEMSARDIEGTLQFRRALVDFKPDNVRMNIEEGRFDGQPLKGHLVVDNFDDPTFNGALSGRCDLTYIKPFLPLQGVRELAGILDFDVRASGRPRDIQSINFSGSLVVSDGKFAAQSLPERIDSLACDLYIDTRVTRINELYAKMPSGHLRMTGRVDNVVAHLLMDSLRSSRHPLTVDANVDTRLNLALLTPFLPQRGHPQLGGTASASLRVTGDASQPAALSPRGKLIVESGTFTDSLLAEPVRALNAALTVAPDTFVIERLDVQFESSDMSLTGKLSHPLPYLLPLESVDRTRLKKPFLQFQLTSHRFDTDRLFPEAVPGSETNRAALPVDSLPPIPVPDIDGSGTVVFDTVIYSRVEFTQMQGQAKIHDRKLTLYEVTGKVYTGDVTGTTTIDLNDFDNPRYTGEFKATQIEADDFVTRFTKFGGHVFGKTNLSGSYEASGWEPEIFLKSLTMDGQADIYDGKLITSGVLYNALAGLAKGVGRSLEKEQPLRGLNTNLAVKDGAVRLDQLKSRIGEVGDLELDGFYAFDGRLGYNGSILLSKKWTEQILSQGDLLSSVAGLFKDQSVDRLKLPLMITGTVDKPEVTVDYSALGESLQDNLSKDIGDLLKGLIKNKDKK